MGGWYTFGEGGGSTRPPGTADADHPNLAKIARRRQADLDFLAWVKTASQADLQQAQSQAKGWRLISIQRRLVLHLQAKNCEV